MTRRDELMAARAACPDCILTEAHLTVRGLMRPKTMGLCAAHFEEFSDYFADAVEISVDEVYPHG